MKTNQQIIDLFPIPTFLIDSNNFEIAYSNNKGLMLTLLNGQSIKKCKITDFIDKEFLNVGEYKNCSFKINAQSFTTGNITVQNLEKEYLIVSFWSDRKVGDDADNISESVGFFEDFRLTKALIDLSTDSIFIVQDGLIQYANPNLLNVSGYKLSDLVGIKFTEFVSPDELEKVYSIFAEREKGINTQTKYESIVKLSDGKFIDVEASFVDISFKGKPAFQVTLRDITKQKIAERKYRNIIDFAPIGFYQTSKDGNFMLANSEMAHILGFNSGEELISKNISAFYFSNEEREKLIKKFNSTTNSEAYNVEIKFRKKNGNPIWVLMTARALKDENQKTLSYDGFIIDISNRKKNESIQKLLLNVSKKSFLNIGLTEYVELIHKELKQIMRADNFYVALYDKNTDKYTFPYHIDAFDEYNNDTTLHLHNTLTNFVRESKQGLLVTEQAEKELRKKYQINLVGEPSPVWLGVPIIDSSNGEAIGVLALQDYNDEKAYNEEDLQTLEIIASNAGLLIERIKNQENLRLAKIVAEENEKRYKSLFYDNKSVMILVDPKTGYIVDANNSACNYYGYSYEQIRTLKIHQINTLPEEEIKVEMQKSLNEIKQHFHFKHKLANGEIKDVEVYSGKISVSGKDLHYSIVYDVSDSKRAEDNVLKLTASIEQIPISIVITNLEGNIEYVNPYFSELTGYDHKDLIGNNPKILNSGIQSKAIYKTLWKTILAGEKWEGEMCNKKKNGEIFWEHAIISPIKNKNGEVTHFVGIKEDITERKRMLEELIKAKDKAEESDRLKTAFLTNMSHEIRTPMNGIIGFTNLLLEPDLDDDTKEEYIKFIHQSGQRMLNTVTDLVEISKIEAGIVEVNVTPIKLNESINKLISFFKPLAQNKGLALITENEPSLANLTLFTDTEKLESILTNLIKNAVKYTFKGNITVAYSTVDGFIEFCIKDTGIGIPQHRMQAIFNPFEQADIEDKRVFEGSGLGLAIAKSYVEMLGGKIWVETVEDEGSKFYFTIPISPYVQETSFDVKIDNTVEKERLLETINLLIVEDEEISAIYLKSILNDVVKSITQVSTGEQAIEQCKTKNGFDLILMDIKMPGIDGFEATRRIREFNKDVIIIAQTAYALAGDKEKAISSGCNDYISKPIKKNEILEIMEKTINNR